MSTKGLMILGVVLAFVLLIVAIPVTSYISAHNLGNRSENDLVRALDHNKNILSQSTNKVIEIAQVPAMMRDDLIKVVQIQLSARYGEKGSNAVFQFLKEQNFSVDPEMYKKIQQVMESRRNDFSNAQDELLDKKKIYKDNLGYFWTGLWLRIAGYPKIDLNEIKILIDEGVSKDFEKGTTGPLMLSH